MQSSPVRRVLSYDEKVERCLELRDLISFSCNTPLYPYNRDISNAIIKATLRQEGEEILILQARQSGKTEAAIQSILAIGVFWISYLRQNFKCGVFAPAQSQAIQVTRDRFKQLFDQLRPLFTQLHLDSYLSAGRTTHIFIIFDAATGKECKIRALSADRTANIKAETFNLIVTEQTEDLDDGKLQNDVFPMAAAVGGVRVLNGTSTLGIQNRYFYGRLLQGGPDVFRVDYRLASKFNRKYADYVNKEKKRLGEDSLAFKTQYALEWGYERLKFIEDRDAFLALQEDYVSSEGLVRSAGWDPAGGADWSVVTVVEGFDKLNVLDWWYSQGTNLEEQCYVVGSWLRERRVKRLAVDAIGLGVGVCDILENHFKGDFKLERVTMDVNTQDAMFKLLDSEVKTARLHFPTMASRSRDLFLEQVLDVERKYQGSKLVVEAPQVSGAHDDFVDCYSPDTDVLTVDGWKSVGSITHEDLVATLSPSRGIEYQQPTELYAQSLDGAAVWVLGSSLELLVSPNHFLFVNPLLRSWDDQFADFALTRADSLFGRKFRYSTEAKWEGRSPAKFGITDDGELKYFHDPRSVSHLAWSFSSAGFMQFLGSFLCDGLVVDNRVVMHKAQQISLHPHVIERCLRRLPFKWDSSGDLVYCRDELFAGCLSKILSKPPRWFFFLSAALLANLFEGIRWGSEHRGGVCLRSSGLADALQEFALKAGTSASVVALPENLFFLKVHRRVGFDSKCLLYKTHLATCKPLVYKGKMFCLAVPNHIIYVRRKGHPCWSGNSLALAVWTHRQKAFKAGVVVAPI